MFLLKLARHLDVMSNFFVSLVTIAVGRELGIQRDLCPTWTAALLFASCLSQSTHVCVFFSMQLLRLFDRGRGCVNIYE